MLMNACWEEGAGMQIPEIGAAEVVTVVVGLGTNNTNTEKHLSPRAVGLFFCRWIVAPGEP